MGTRNCSSREAGGLKRKAEARPLLSAFFLMLAVLAHAEAEGREAGNPAIVVSAPVVALIDVRIIDGTGRPPVDHQTIVIAEGRITAVGANDSVAIPADARKLQLNGRTVLPGLVMLHEHLNYFSGRAIWHSQPLSFPPLYLAAGVTTIRTAGTESPQIDLNVKRRIDHGQAPGPKIHLTGPIFNGVSSNFLGDYVLGTPAEARRAVNYWADLGFTSFKVYTDIAPDVLGGVVEAAHARGLRVAGHLASVTCREASSLGIDTIEHAFGSCSELGESRPEVSDARVQELIHQLVAAGVVLIVTPVAPWRPISEEEVDMLHPQARENYLKDAIAPPQWWPTSEDQSWQRKLEREFVAAGGRIGLGADPGNPGAIAGYADHRALALLVEAGWDPLDVIRLATSNNAEILGVGDAVGRIAIGFAADLMLTPADPLQEIEALSEVEMVFKDGVGYSPEALKASVKGSVGWH